MTGQVRTVDGRVAGRRGQETRRKLLTCLDEMLSSSPYRDVRVIDVARRAGTSPATFYQYFPDVEGAVLELAEEMSKESSSLSELATDRTWTGKAGWRTAEDLVDGLLSFWRENDAILRVVDLGAAEGDKRFSKIRAKVLGGITGPLADSIGKLQSKGKTDPDISATAVAGSLVSMLTSVAGQQKAAQSWGAKKSDLKPSLAYLLYLGVTGRKPSR
ncbi:TetR family transcriptional regulator [Streptomyces sp. CNQ085]|uniref:TetR family transcriptional regulator n=1 Tax=Streptomyces sp. CNQ085 TaxID=2886944 RepID=UPI001F5084AC|nr:TetR family transcriptional regulator [Streptomyces sp. CNQ085]MCI0386619.1 TetR/AcrR family transcriptional regulator [Streptomyces sp. CNQ085]